MGFVEPIALAFSGLLGVLVALYLWERRRREVAVPSLLLWQALREDTVRAQRFRPDLLFLLQALALACLIIGLAKPYLERVRDSFTPARHILVLDTSASMGARESGGTRWTLAKTKALQALHDLPEGTEVMLISSSDTPEVVVPFTRQRRDIEQALARLEPADTGGELSVALAYANSARARSDVPTSVTVYSDRPVSELPPAARSQVNFVHVGSSDDNLAIEALQVFQGRLQDPRSATLEVRVRNYSGRDRHGLLTVQLNDRVLLRTGFTLAPRATQSFTAAGLPGPGRVVAQVAADDALPVDDIAYGWVRPLRPLHLLVVTPTRRWAEALTEMARVTPGLEVTVIAPNTAWPDTPVDVALFYRTAPAQPHAVNTMYIYPPADSGLFTALGDITNADILDWNARHPIVRLLRPVNVQPFARARMVTPPPGSQGLLWSRNADHEFPLAFANEQNGHRSVYLMFDLEADQLLSNDNVGLFLFFLNSLVWLAPERDDTVVARAGETYAIADASASEIAVRDPHGAERTLVSTPLALTPRYAGEYRLRVAGGERSLLVNFQNPAESDIGRPPEPQPASVGVDKGTVAAATVGAPPPDFGHWVYAAGVVLLLTEWAIAARRRA